MNEYEKIRKWSRSVFRYHPSICSRDWRSTGVSKQYTAGHSWTPFINTKGYYKAVKVQRISCLGAFHLRLLRPRGHQHFRTNSVQPVASKNILWHIHCLILTHLIWLLNYS